MNILTLNEELGEWVKGNIGIGFLRDQTEEELLYMSKEVNRMALEAYAELEEMADECDYDLTHNKHFQKNFRMMMTETGSEF